MDNVTTKRKWYNWKLIGIVIILLAIFIKFYVLREHDENAPVTVELDLSEVAFRNEQEVEAVLGKGTLDSYFRDDAANCEKCPKMIYKEGKIEIIFINEIADRIMIKNLTDVEFADRVILGLLNLKENIKPVVDSDELKQWDNYQKYSQISAFGKKGKVEYILIKAKTL
ncbi:hypothetical protein [Dyadobacter psychrotolerans]|uniref:Uncharacterized protein n=1 Tax=Dyadobacter psychrotolerans TaxID=2541721 RepID=A0A4R5DZZ3_9BACT|nr:hypothetical protein [Dyadobacter psychrotolerans]TDE16843.1 hypothetical protein E0F88_11530 [Dyadobacter psychrotolerans]